MARTSDMKRPQSVNAEFDEGFEATPHGGAVLLERVLRRQGVRRLIETHLPSRSEDCEYSTVDGVYALIGALMLGGHGIQAVEALRENAMDTRIFGLEQGAPSESTMHNILGDLSGLAPRKRAEAYREAGPVQPSLDMLGHERKESQLRRVLSEEPESAAPEHLEQLRGFTAAMAKRCIGALKSSVVRLHGFTVVFGDATDLEVEGRCFDAAERNYEGSRCLRWSTLLLGPVTVAEEVGRGARDEAKAIAGLLDRGRDVVRDVVGRWGRVLGLLDSAYFEKEVVERTRAARWRFIICANRLREVLTRKVLEQPAEVWMEGGADERRGWVDSQFAVFAHRPQGWAFNATIVAARWREAGDLPEVWRYSFLGTDLERGDLVKGLLRQHGYARLIWMLYGTKQGRENHYKTALRDFDLHHPPSSRLGINQAFYAVATAAVNLAMVLRYRVVQGPDTGIQFWRLRERYIHIAGAIVQGARTLTVRLSGACVDAARKALWLAAFAETLRL